VASLNKTLADRTPRRERSLLRELTAATGGMLPIVVALVVVWTFFQTLNAHFLSARNLTNLLLQISSTGIIATGVVLVLLIGEIDLSVGSVAGVSAAILAVLMSVYAVPWWLAVLAMIAVGGGIGALQGTWLVMFGVPSFIVTLAGLLGWYGLQLYMIQTQHVDTIMVEEPHIVAIASTFVPRFAGWVLAGVLVVTVAAGRVVNYRRRRAAGFTAERAGEAVVRTVAIVAAILGATAVLDQWRGVPVAAMIFIGLVAALSWIAQRTPFGRYMYAIGGNANAAHRAGIKVRALRIMVFVLSGALAALGGLVAVARLAAADTGTGGGTVLLEAIAAAVIGGISLFGGRGSVWGAFFGSLVIGSVSNGLDLTGNEATVKYMVEGLILLIAVTADVMSRRGRLREERT
jgi:D-xylose transport system permease protein